MYENMIELRVEFYENGEIVFVSGDGKRYLLDQSLMNEVAAYAVGSKWFCTICGIEKRDDGIRVSPVRRGSLLLDYSYRCDKCKKYIE